MMTDARDLLEALKSLLKLAERYEFMVEAVYDEYGVKNDGRIAAEILAARVIIARAEGRTP